MWHLGHLQPGLHLWPGLLHWQAGLLVNLPAVWVVHFAQWQAPKNKAAATMVITFFMRFVSLLKYTSFLHFTKSGKLVLPFFSLVCGKAYKWAHVAADGRSPIEYTREVLAQIPARECGGAE